MTFQNLDEMGYGKDYESCQWDLGKSLTQG